VIGSAVSPALLGHYSLLLSHPNADVQYTAAFSFSAVALSVGPTRFSAELLHPFHRCCSSPDVRVRRTLSFALASFAAVVDRSALTDAAFDLVRDVPDVSIGAISSLSDILPLVDDQAAFVVCLRSPGARFVAWRMRIVVSQQLRRCAPFFDRTMLLDCASELIDDAVACVRIDAVRSVGALMREDDVWMADDFANSVNHWTRLCAARILQIAALAVARRASDTALRLARDPVVAVREAAQAAWGRIAGTE
jgi:hypothetical protein